MQAVAKTEACTVGESEQAAFTERRSLHLLQVMRGVAAVMVVVLHASTVATERFGNRHAIWFSGAAGVDIFFVISGFVMALSSRSLGLGVSAAGIFFKRRVERIVPLYWLFTTLKVGLGVVAPESMLRAVGSAGSIVCSYLFMPNRNAVGRVLPVVSVGWTLNFEMMFYVLFAIALALGVTPLRLLIPVLSGMALASIFIPSGSAAVLAWCDPIVLEFLFGMLLYEAWQRRWRLPAGWAWIALAGGAAVIAIVPWGEGSRLRPLVWGLPALAMVTAAIDLEGRFGRKAPAWALEIGDASYSIYLAHTFVLPVVAMALAHMGVQWLQNMGPVILICLAASLAAGVLVYRLVELPIMSFFRMRRMAVVHP